MERTESKCRHCQRVPRLGVRMQDLPLIPTHTHVHIFIYIILPIHKCAYVCSPSSQCRHSVYDMPLQAPRAVAMMAVSPGEAYCEDDTVVLYYYIPEGVRKTNKGDAENEFHL